jgi:chromatin structure-remodeling complex subunit RSC4
MQRIVRFMRMLVSSEYVTRISTLLTCLTLSQEYFHHSMSDLPPPYAIPEYSSYTSSSKIMLKVPAASTSYPSTSEAPVASAHATIAPSTVKSSGSVLLRVPGLHTDNQLPSQAQTSVITTSPVVNAPKVTPIAITRTLSTTAYASTTHYPNAAYQPHVEHSAPVSNLHVTLPSTTFSDGNSNVNTFSQSSTKSPVPSPTRTFRCMVLITKPQERRLELDHSEGVRIWAMKLGKNETSLSIRGIQFTVDEEEEDDTEMDKEEEEEEEEEVPEVKVKGRGRKKGKAKASAKVAKTSLKKQKSNPIQDEELSVRINGSVIQSKSEPFGEWDVDVPWGPNVLEVSEKGGAAWKVYIERGA